MRLFLIFIFNVYIKVKCVSSQNCAIECQPNQDVFCVEITSPDGSAVYTRMYECVVQQFRCLEKNVTVSYVDMLKCHVERPSKPERLRRGNELYSSDLDVRERNEECPTTCPSPTRNGMVCARYANGIYLSFLSNCYLKIYQCKHPGEKLELVSLHSCYAFAPVLSDLPRPDGEIQPRGQDDILDFIDARTNNLSILHGVSIITPKPTIKWIYSTRHRRTTRHPDKTTKNKPTKTKPTKTRPTRSKPTKTRPTRSKPTKTKPTITMITTEPILATTQTQRATTEKDVRFTVEEDTCDDKEEQEERITVPDSCASSDGVLTTEREYMKVDISPDAIEDTAPIWQGSKKGARIFSQIRADMGFMVRCEVYAGVDYSGHIMVNSMKDNDFIGLVFGYQSNRHFYLVTWKAVPGKYWRGEPFIANADAGVHIKLVNSSTGPNIYLRNSIYSTESSAEQVTLLWQDPLKKGWKHKTSYSWQLIHRPHIGLIRIKILDGSDVVVDSGNVFDSSYNGGRIGVFCFSQENVIWSQMKWQCNDKVPSNVMSELPEDLQKKSVEDKDYIF